MNFSSSLQRRLQWFNLPTAVLITLLQRTPVVRVVAAVEEMVISSPISAVLKSVATAVASLGAINSMAGATPLQVSTGTESGVTVAVGVVVSVGYSATSPLGPAASWSVDGTPPPGLSFSNFSGNNMLLSGTPTTAGTFPVVIHAFGPNAGEQADYPYTVTVTGGGGGGTIPAFTTQPTANQTVTVGANVTLTVVVTGTPTPTIQWRKGGTPIGGATNLSLTLNNVQTTDSGTYTAAATNTAGTTVSSNAVLTVTAANTAPAFTTHPATQSVTAGANVTFTVAVTGNPTPTIQWTKGGVNIAGATNTTLTLNSVQAGDAGTYAAVATNSVSSVTSNNAVLTVGAAPAAPAFTTQPLTQTVTQGGTATFTVAVTGTPTPTVKWTKGGVDIAGATTTTLTLNNVQPADAATYAAVATNTAGTATSTGAVLTVTASSVPTITTQPQGHTIATGGSVVFGVDVTGGGLSYQWKKNGGNIAGATANQYLITNVQASDAGSYTVTATNGSGSVTSTAAGLAVISTGDPGRIINVSVRTVSGADSNVLIMGFVTGGAGTAGTKTMLIRGIGPTLGDFGVPGTMVDPVLDVIQSGIITPIVTNDNWGGDAGVTTTANSVGAFALPTTTSKDAALVTTLPGGVYSAKVSGKLNTTGTVLAEIYDANAAVFVPSAPRLVNVSARVVSSNDNPLIAGFVIGGSTAKTVMIRGIGPFLSAFFGASAMSDPKLELFVRQGPNDNLMLSNDNWGGSALATSTGNSVGAFALSDLASKDAVLLVTLDPGIYSAKVLGVNNVSGITLVEIYDVP